MHKSGSEKHPKPFPQHGAVACAVVAVLCNTWAELDHGGVPQTGAANKLSRLMGFYDLVGCALPQVLPTGRLEGCSSAERQAAGHPMHAGPPWPVSVSGNLLRGQDQIQNHGSNTFIANTGFVL